MCPRRSPPRVLVDNHLLSSLLFRSPSYKNENKSTHRGCSIFLGFRLCRVVSESLEPAEAGGALWGGLKDKRMSQRQLAPFRAARFTSVTQQHVRAPKSRCIIDTGGI